MGNYLQKVRKNDAKRNADEEFLLLLSIHTDLSPVSIVKPMLYFVNNELILEKFTITNMQQDIYFPCSSIHSSSQQLLPTRGNFGLALVLFYIF